MHEDQKSSAHVNNIDIEPPNFTILGSVEELALGGGSEAADTGVETAASKAEVNPPGVGRVR